jgi:hypothetical protein
VKFIRGDFLKEVPPKTPSRTFKTGKRAEKRKADTSKTV